MNVSIRIDWSLFNNDNVIIENKNILCEFIDNKIIKYQEDTETSNIIDLDNSLFIRENSELMFKIDFNKEEFTYILKSKNYTIKDKLLISDFLREDKTIILKYGIDEETKKLVIKML